MLTKYYLQIQFKGLGKQPFEDVFIIFFIKLLIFQQNIENRKYNIKEKHVEN